MLRTALSASSLLLLLVTTGCEARGPDTEGVHEAIRQGAAGALSARVIRNEAQPVMGEPGAMPRVAEGLPLRFVHDDAHQRIDTARFGDRIAVTWTTRDRDGIWFGVTDPRGVAEGQAQRLYAAVPEEERADAPTVVAGAEGFALAWIDPENGRVMFRRLDAARRPLGSVEIVHEGLEAPRSVSLARGRQGYGLVAALWQGVYFARLDDRGVRVGEGAMLSEGVAVSAVDPLRWDRDAFAVAFTTAESGRVERRIAPVSRARSARSG